jgi:DNA-binding LacI/PurR family transcriptional regulator
VENTAGAQIVPPVTLRTLADQLGLHISTVSRVLHPKPDESLRAASGATVERIRKLADELGYQPNPHATSLRTRRSNLVGVLVPRFLDDIATRNVPFVLVSRRAGEHPSVTCDDLLGGRLVAEHLLSLGHRNVAVIAGEPYASTGIDRTAGFVGICAEAGIEIPVARLVHSGFDAQGGRVRCRAPAARWRHSFGDLRRQRLRAIAAIGAVRDHGLRVGHDVALVGFNDTPLAAELPVPLTTVRSPMLEMGRRGLDLLVRRIQGAEVGSERLRPELMVRASSDPSLQPSLAQQRE